MAAAGETDRRGLDIDCICLVAIPAGVWLGWRFHGALDQRQIYRACYGLLVVTAMKLLWDGVSATAE